jgi:hypothetical protein
VVEAIAGSSAIALENAKVGARGSTGTQVKNKQGAVGITTAAPCIAGQWGRGE